MARKNVIYSSTHPYHLGGRTNHGERFPLSLDRAWEVFANELFLSQKFFGIEIYAFVLMSNHFHLMLGTPEANVSEFAQYFMKKTSFHINDLSGRNNHLWGQRNHKTLILNDSYFQACRKYIYRNPVSAGVTNTCLDYKYSTLRSTLGFEKQIFGVKNWPELFTDTDATLRWLNRKPNSEHNDRLGKALKRGNLTKILDRNRRQIDYTQF